LILFNCKIIIMNYSSKLFIILTNLLYNNQSKVKVIKKIQIKVNILVKQFVRKI